MKKFKTRFQDVMMIESEERTNKLAALLDARWDLFLNNHLKLTEFTPEERTQFFGVDILNQNIPLLDRYNAWVKFAKTRLVNWSGHLKINIPGTNRTIDRDNAPWFLFTYNTTLKFLGPKTLEYVNQVCHLFGIVPTHIAIPQEMWNGENPAIYILGLMHGNQLVRMNPRGNFSLKIFESAKMDFTQPSMTWEHVNKSTGTYLKKYPTA